MTTVPTSRKVEKIKMKMKNEIVKVVDFIEKKLQPL